MPQRDRQAAPKPRLPLPPKAAKKPAPAPAEQARARAVAQGLSKEEADGHFGVEVMSTKAVADQ